MKSDWSVGGVTAYAMRVTRDCRTVGSAKLRLVAPESELARARALYEEMYGGFTVKHFHEKSVN